MSVPGGKTEGPRKLQDPFVNREIPNPLIEHMALPATSASGFGQAGAVSGAWNMVGSGGYLIADLVLEE